MIANDSGNRERQPKPYVTASVAARLIGIQPDALVADICRGNAGQNAFAVAGAKVGEFWLVHSYELEGDRLEMHRKRLTSGSAESRD